MKVLTHQVARLQWWIVTRSPKLNRLASSTFHWLVNYSSLIKAYNVYANAMSLLKYMTRKSVDQKCFLRSIASGDKIALPDKTDVIIGRSLQYGIDNLKCSKEQVICTANYANFKVQIKVIGSGPSGLNGFALDKDKTYTAGHESRLEVLLDTIIYEIIFEPPPPTNGLKRKSDVLEAEKSDSNKKKCEEMTFERLHDGKLLVIGTNGLKQSEKLASFDLDGTLIRVKSGARFPKDADDWTFAYRNVPAKLEQLQADGFRIVIFTNQGGIGRGNLLTHDFRNKLKQIISALPPLAVEIYVATSSDIHRKPALGMWNEFLKRNGTPIDFTTSFYCGDAAGRPKDWKLGCKKDHSNCDRTFAINAGLKFLTPEEFFRNEPPGKFVEPSFDPRKIPKNLNLVENGELISKNQEILILVGPPASGKSFISQNHLVPAGYERINRDTLKTMANCLKVLDGALRAGRRAVIDNTNIDRETRGKYVQVARDRGVGVRCAVVNVTLDHVLHNNVFRNLTDRKHEKINKALILSYRKHYQEPSMDEGFDEIIKVNFVPKFTDAKLEEMYYQFLPID